MCLLICLTFCFWWRTVSFVKDTATDKAVTPSYSDTVITRIHIGKFITIKMLAWHFLYVTLFILYVIYIFEAHWSKHKEASIVLARVPCVGRPRVSPFCVSERAKLIRQLQTIKGRETAWNNNYYENMYSLCKTIFSNSLEYIYIAL